MKFDRDIHLLTAEIRFRFLDFLGVTQKTTGIPKPGLNIVEHFIDNNLKDLKRRTEQLSNLPGSEGQVVTAADSSYKLTSGARPFSSLKFHNSSILIAKCISSKETKTKGIYNLDWAILPGSKYKNFANEININEKIYIRGGTTFSTNENPEGKNIIIEFETFNLVYNKNNDIYKISAWSPRYLGVSSNEIDNVDNVVNRSIKDRVYQAKTIYNDSVIYHTNKDFDIQADFTEDAIDIDNIYFQSFYEIPINTKELENKALINDWRLICAHYAAWLNMGDNFKFTLKDIFDTADEIINEIKNRILLGKIDFNFHLNTMKPTSKSLYLKTRIKLKDNLKKLGEIKTNG